MIKEIYLQLYCWVLMCQLSFKMDVSAILNADDKLLKDMGLIKDGDRVSLRGFCKSCSLPENEQSDEKKKQEKKTSWSFLGKKERKQSPVFSQKRTRSDHTFHTGKPEKVKTKMVHFGWKHYNEDLDSYVLVPLAKGGGTRQLNLPVSTSKWDLMYVRLSISQMESLFVEKRRRWHLT